jgi:L-lactate dehydrogenase complex protein LldG
VNHPDAHSGEAAFLARVRAALGRRDRGAPQPQSGAQDEVDARQAAALERIAGRGRAERLALLETLGAAAAALHLQCLPLPDLRAASEAIAALAAARQPEWSAARQAVAWRHPLVDRLDLEQALGRAGIALVRPCGGDGAQERRRLRDAAAGALLGVTAADWAVAESATLVLRTRPGQPRGVSLLPSLHVAVIGLGQVLASFTELYALLCRDAEEVRQGLGVCTTFISGPSKTADIEACMVHGAHGPREMVLIVITGG